MLSSPTNAFNLLPARVWQFLAGGLAHDVILLITNHIISCLQCSNNAKCNSSTIKYEQLRTDEVITKILKINMYIQHTYINYEEKEQSKIFKGLIKVCDSKNCAYFSDAFGHLSAGFLSLSLYVLVLLPFMIVSNNTSHSLYSSSYFRR